MDLEVLGRHALLFDDDTLAAFVNSGDALVEWHSLQIDRYDVRHLLGTPPPPRRRNRTTEPDVLDYLSLESQLDHDRYLDLPSHADQPDVEEDERRMDTLGCHAVAFSYGNTDDLIDNKNTDDGMESSGFLPGFPIPGDLRHCLDYHVKFSDAWSRDGLLVIGCLTLATCFHFDVMTRSLQAPTEKVHQIIARTAMFVSKHGGQSEIILRVKQGDNPSFGFLMPDHQLHAYFRYLVEHPDLLNAESDGSPGNDGKKADIDHKFSDSVGGALSLLGSVYGSGEEEDGQDSVNTVNNVSQDCNSSEGHSISLGSKNIQSRVDSRKDESMSRNLILSNKEKVLKVKKNSLITVSKSGTVKGMEEEARISSADSDKAKNLTAGTTSNIDPVILEPPPDLKRLIEKLVEFIMRNGKQFEATLVEQDRKHGRFPFLLPSDKHHSYYLKVLKTAQESKANGKNIYCGKDDLLGRRMDRKFSLRKEKDSAFCDLPPESDKKEKFKMVIGKSKKEAQETEPKGSQQEYGITVDAAATVAILEAATRGIKQAGSQIISSTPNSHVHVSCSEDGQPGYVGNLLLSQRDNTVAKSGQTDSQNGSDVKPKASGRTATNEADSAETHLTREQRLKAERLKRAKMFVAKLKGGEVPIKTGTSCSLSLEPLESGVSSSAIEVDNDGKGREGSSLTPVDKDRPATGEKAERKYSIEEHTQRLSKRKYRVRSGCEDDGGNSREHECHSRRDCRSRSRGDCEDYDNGRSMEMEQNFHQRESSDKEKGHKHYKSKHRSHHSVQVDEHGDKYKNDKNHKRSRKKHDSDSSCKHVHKRRSSKQHPEEEDECDDHGRERKHSRKKHRTHHSKDKHAHQSENTCRGKESRSNLRHGLCSDDNSNYSHRARHTSELRDERNDLEEGEISSRVSEGSRGIASRVGRETSVEGVSSHQLGIPSQPSETAEVPDDLRAKIRAMLMATR